MENQTTSNAPQPEKIYKGTVKILCWWCGRKHKGGFHDICWKEFCGWMLS